MIFITKLIVSEPDKNTNKNKLNKMEEIKSENIPYINLGVDGIFFVKDSQGRTIEIHVEKGIITAITGPIN